MTINLSKKFSPKQQQILREVVTNPDWRIMVNYGAIRSGKTYVDNFIFFIELYHAAQIAKAHNIAKPLYILAGASSKSIETNVLTEIFNTFGIEFHFDKHNSFQYKFRNLPAINVIQIFTQSIAGLKSARGFTATGAYVNEAALANEEVFHEIVNRCSITGSRVVCDTNPDVPTHWLKTDYIDKAGNVKQIIANHFVLEDNTHLANDYLDSIKATTPSGMFYDRAIRGLWVAGEGLVYQDFDKSKNVITHDKFTEMTKDDRLTYYAGVDWGYEHKGVIVVLADDSQGNTYLVEEHTRKHKDIEYWVKVAKDIQQRYGFTIPMYCDSARPEYVQRFQDENFHAKNAYKIRLTGVEMVASRIKSRHFLVLEDVIEDNQSKFLDELYQYIWDEKSGEPVKLNDDVMDATRYAIATRQWLLEHKEEDDDIVEQSQLLADKGLIDYPDDVFWE